MKVLTGAVLALLFALVRPPIANVAEIEPFGVLSGTVGAERETGEPRGDDIGRAGVRGTADFTGIIPLPLANFGIQGSLQYVGGLGSRIGLGLGPVFAFDGGKSGLFLNYQHRGFRNADFLWITPALSYYMDQVNLNISYTHPISSVQSEKEDAHGSPTVKTRIEMGLNRLQTTASYFPPVDLPFAPKDNLELTFGLQVNAFAGPSVGQIRGAGVGPVFGASVMPWQNLEVNLVKASFDNRSRYQVNSGLRFFFAKAGTSLKELRRKYMDVGPGPVGSYTAEHLD